MFGVRGHMILPQTRFQRQIEIAGCDSTYLTALKGFELDYLKVAQPNRHYPNSRTDCDLSLLCLKTFYCSFYLIMHFFARGEPSDTIR